MLIYKKKINCILVLAATRDMGTDLPSKKMSLGV